MSIKTREELVDSIKVRAGDNLDDETIAIIEDINDTITDYEEKVKKWETEWKNKYEENDKMWRQKYTDRFLSGEPEHLDTGPKPDEKKITKFEDLFSVKE